MTDIIPEVTADGSAVIEQPEEETEVEADAVRREVSLWIMDFLERQHFTKEQVEQHLGFVAPFRFINDHFQKRLGDLYWELIDEIPDAAWKAHANVCLMEVCRKLHHMRDIGEGKG